MLFYMCMRTQKMSFTWCGSKRHGVHGAKATRHIAQPCMQSCSCVTPPLGRRLRVRPRQRPHASIQSHRLLTCTAAGAIPGYATSRPHGLNIASHSATKPAHNNTHCRACTCIHVFCAALLTPCKLLPLALSCRTPGRATTNNERVWGADRPCASQRPPSVLPHACVQAVCVTCKSAQQTGPIAQPRQSNTRAAVQHLTPCHMAATSHSRSFPSHSAPTQLRTLKPANPTARVAGVSSCRWRPPGGPLPRVIRDFL